MFESLGHYKILDRIGAGGMGEVFRARDTRFGRTVAIKVPGPEVVGDPERREALVRDARAISMLSHPNVATLNEVGDDQGHLFLVFEFVPGQTLTSIIGGRRLHPRKAIDLAIQIADALADAADIVHGDLKPDNVIVTPKGNAKLLDFGFAAWTTGGAVRAQIARGADVRADAVLRTAAYMSPEQVLGERLDHRSDIFSLGVILFEMLTGRLPFEGGSASALAVQIAQAAPPPPSAVERTLPAEVDPILAKALAKSLEQRYESAATLAAELRSVAAILDVRSDASEAAAAPVVPTTRHRSFTGWIVLAIALAAVAAAFLLFRGR